jgi:hypothetical protein
MPGRKHSSSARVHARAALWLAALSLALLCSDGVRAAGIEDTVGGGMGLGRAAYVARVNDFMAIALNPANLAVAPRADFGFELRLPVLQSCFDREIDPNVEYKQPGVYEGFQGSESFGRVCNEAIPSPTANLGWSNSFDGWGYGIGVFTPGAVGASSYGRGTIVSWFPSESERHQTTDTGVESPNRQMGMKRDGVLAFLMLGLGAAPSKELRFGVSAGWGVANVYNKSVVSVLGGTFRDQEIVNELRVTDWAIPRVVSSIVFSPTDMLDLFAVANYQGDIDGRGRATLTANGIQGAPLKSCSAMNPGTHCYIDDVRLQVPFPTMEATFGARFGLPRRPRERVLDPMKDEYFDIELDAAWTQTSKVQDFKVTLHDKEVTDPDVPRIQFANAEDASTSYPRKSTLVPKRWRDTWSVRAGSDINLVPGVFTVRGGFSFTQRATPVEYMNIDYWPVQKLGIHAGTTVAFGRFKLTAAYARLIYQTVKVQVGTGGVKDIASLQEVQSTGVNEGTFRASQNVFSFQLNAGF